MPVRTVSFSMFNGIPKVRNNWTQVFGGGELWYKPIARITLRKNLGKEPSAEDLAKLSIKRYKRLSKSLEGDIDKAFCEGEEVHLIRFN